MVEISLTYNTAFIILPLTKRKFLSIAKEDKMREIRRYVILAALVAAIWSGSARPLQAHDLVTYDFSSIDAHALATPASEENSIEALAAYLARPASNDLEKVRALFVWITNNIAYDGAAFASGNIRSEDQEAGAVLRNRQAVCYGYASLFVALGKAMGLEVVSISGYAKGVGFTTGEIQERNNHDWNAVKINGVWHLLDSTWGAGSLRKNFHFKKEFDDFYFLTPPEKLIYSHFPADPTWQLISKPVSRVDFFNQIYVKPPFFKNQLEAVSHHNSVIFANGEVVISLRAPDNVAISSSLITLENKEIPCQVERKDGLVLIKAAIPEPGDYSLEIYSSLKGNSFNFTLAYRVICIHKKALEDGDPLTTDQQDAYGVRPSSHKSYLISTGADLGLTLKAPPDMEIMAHLMDLDNHILSPYLVKVDRDSDQALIQAQFPKPGIYYLNVFGDRHKSYERNIFIMQYKVQANSSAGETAGFVKPYPKFTEFNLELVSHTQPMIKTGSNIDIVLKAPHSVTLDPKLSRNGVAQKENHVLVRREGDLVIISLIFPQPGTYSLRIYAWRPRSGSNIIHEVLDYEIVAESGAGENAGFVETDEKFHELGLRLVSHTQPRVNAGSDLTISLDAPPDIDIFTRLIKDKTQLRDNLIQVSRTGNIIRISLLFPEPGLYSLEIFAWRTQSGDLTSYKVAKYEISADKGLGDAAGFFTIFPDFELLGIEPVSHKEWSIKSSAECTVVVNAPQGVVFMATLERNGKPTTPNPTVSRNGEVVTIKFTVPAPGTFALKIAAGREKDHENVIQVKPVLKYEVQRAQ